MLNHDFKYILQSSWLSDMLKEHMPQKGFLVEIGVGHTTTVKSRESGFSIVDLFGSNTAELLDIGWSGVYIDPVAEFCFEASLLHKDKTDRLKIVNLGASDTNEVCTLYGEETLIPNGKLNYKDCSGVPYTYPGRKVTCLPTSTILSSVCCPEKIDFMSIDVEGYELKVLKGIDFSLHKVGMFFIETTRVTVNAVESVLPFGYKLLKTDGFNTCWILEGM